MTQTIKIVKFSAQPVPCSGLKEQNTWVKTNKKDSSPISNTIIVII